MLVLTCTTRGRRITPIFRTPLFKISVWGRLWLRVNNGRRRFRHFFLRGHERRSRFGFYFQRPPQLSDFFLNQQAVTALRQSFQS